jgi:hypothetical protein
MLASTSSKAFRTCIEPCGGAKGRRYLLLDGPPDPGNCPYHYWTRDLMNFILLKELQAWTKACG